MSPAPSLWSRSVQLPEITKAWWESKSQYVTEYCNSTASATVTSAPAGILTTDQDKAEDALFEAEYLLDNVDRRRYSRHGC